MVFLLLLFCINFDFLKKCCIHVLLMLITEGFFEPILNVASGIPFPSCCPHPGLTKIFQPFTGLWRGLTELMQGRSSVRGLALFVMCRSTGSSHQRQLPTKAAIAATLIFGSASYEVLPLAARLS